MKFYSVNKVLLLFALTILFNGCLTTLYPFFTEKDVVFNPELIGDWAYSNKSEKGSILFETITQNKSIELSEGIRKMTGKGYLVTWKDSIGQPTSQYFVFLAKIGKHFYLDFYPADMDDERPVDRIFKGHKLKLHHCYKVNFHSKDRLEIKMFEESFLTDLIEKKQIRIHYEEKGSFDKKRIITASTDELQQYLLKYSNNPKAYSEVFSYNCKRIINY